jgi:hypothetical protein
MRQVAVQPLHTAQQLQPTDISPAKPELLAKQSSKSSSKQATDDADADTTDTTATETGSESKVGLLTSR